MILILTPTYKAFELIKQQCDAIDSLTQNDYLHVLIDDDSGDAVPYPVESSERRRILRIKRDVPGVIHKNGGANAIQLGYDFAYQPYCNEDARPDFDHIFVIEQDVIPLEKGWDQKQIDLIAKAPEDWGTIDIQSVDEEGKVTYPCTVSPRHDEFQNEEFEWLHYCDWQCTLFNKKLFELGMRFNNVPSHFDVLFGRRMFDEFKLKAYRARSLKALHVQGGGNSRAFLK